MKSLYESILDDQDEVMDKMTDKMQYRCMEKFLNTHLWPWSNPNSRFDKVKYKYGKDSEGFYIETEGYIRYTQSGDSGCKNFAEWQDKIRLYNEKWPETHKGDLCPKFRWKSHKGSIALADNLQNVESLEGIPNTPIEQIFLPELCGCRKRSIDISGKRISRIKLHNTGAITLVGDSKTKVDEIEWTRSYNSIKPMTRGFKCTNMHQEKGYFD